MIHWFDIPIGPSAWSVVLSVPEASIPLKDSEGATEPNESRIYINARMPRDRWADIFKHELLHAVIYVAGVDKSFELDTDREGRLVAQLAPVLCDALVRGGLFRLPRAPRVPREWRGKASRVPAIEVTMGGRKRGR